MPVRAFILAAAASGRRWGAYTAAVYRHFSDPQSDRRPLAEGGMIRVMKAHLSAHRHYCGGSKCGRIAWGREPRCNLHRSHPPGARLRQGDDCDGLISRIAHHPKTGYVWVPAINIGSVYVMDTRNDNVREIAGFATNEVELGGRKRSQGPPPLRRVKRKVVSHYHSPAERLTQFNARRV